MTTQDQNACCRADVMASRVSLSRFEAQVDNTVAESENRMHRFWMPTLAMRNEEKPSTLRRRDCDDDGTPGTSLVRLVGMLLYCC